MGEGVDLKFRWIRSKTLCWRIWNSIQHDWKTGEVGLPKNMWPKYPKLVEFLLKNNSKEYCGNELNISKKKRLSLLQTNFDLDHKSLGIIIIICFEGKS